MIKINRGKYTFVICFTSLMIISLYIILHVHPNFTLSEGSRKLYSWLSRNAALPRFKSNAQQVNCSVGYPCAYPETVDLRIIVMSYNRDLSLLKLLHSLNDLEMDGDSAALEIWIDKSKSGAVHNNTVKIAESFNWQRGIKRVHIQEAHAGIYGQWIDTWKPKPGSSELAMLLEDDLLVSPFAWRWIKAVNMEYGHRADCFGFTLQSEQVSDAVKRSALRRPAGDVVFMYQLVGSWGFVPSPSVWSNFQDWFHKAVKNKSFRPYVNGLTMTKWYKNFEKKGTEDSMWTMWFIYFCNKYKLFGVYNNLNHVEGKKDRCLAVHRAEPGLHYTGKSRTGVEVLLLNKWNKKYIEFPKAVKKYLWNGKHIF